MASVEAWTERVGVSKGGSARVFQGKELPDREEKSRQLNGLNNVLLTAEMRSTPALQVPYSTQPMQNYATRACSDCKIHRQFQGLNAENLLDVGAWI